MNSDKELGHTLYGDGKPAPESPEKAAGPEDFGKSGAAVDARLAETLYGPPQDPRFARVDDQGNVEELIRDRDGRIMHRGFVSDPATLVRRNPRALQHADLQGLQLPDLPGGDLREADLRGAVLGDLSGADLRGVELDSSTDIAGANFAGCVLDAETYNRLVQCRGFHSAKCLGRPLAEG